MRSRLTAAVAVLALALGGCVPTQPSPTTAPPSQSLGPMTDTSPAPGPSSFTLGTLPRIDGSTAAIPLISLMIQRLTGASKADADNSVAVTTTPDAYRALVAGTTDLLLVYEADEKVKREVADSGVELESHPIGRDALVFFTNASNPVTSLTTEQYREIYSGRTTNWKQVGGADAAIVAYQRPEESGSQALMRSYVMGDQAMAKAPAERVSGDMGSIIEAVANYSNDGNALGYSVYYYLANMYAVDGIKMLGVSGVLPSSDTIADGSYPYVNDFYAIIRADEPPDSPARRAQEWLSSPEGRQAVIDAGYVPARP